MKPPTPTTLKKYGLSLTEWMIMYDKFQGACHICHKVPNGRLNVDHHHIKNWAKLEPEERKQWVRGLLCFT